MKDLTFEYLQDCIKNDFNINLKSAKLFDSSLSDDQINELVKGSSLMYLDCIKNGETQFKSILNFDNITNYLNHLHTKITERKNTELNSWIQDRPARKFFSIRKPKCKKEELLFDKMEESITIIDEYWDTKYFNEKELAKQFICICERDYGGENRIGIMVKQEAYAHQYQVIVRGLIGPYNISNEGNGFDLEFEMGAERFSLSKSYQNLPTKDELIDDFISLDILENQSPVDHIHNDIGTIPIYPTAKEYFK